MTGLRTCNPGAGESPDAYMQLTSFTDYALRVLVYLSREPRRIVPTADISEAYGVSQFHLGKVVHRLGRSGWVEVRRGRGGGLRLAMPPEEIRIGAVVRDLEPSFRLVECFDEENNNCPIAPVCGLAPELDEALGAFHAALDRYTLADVIAGRKEALRAHYLQGAPPAPPAAGT